MTNFKTETHRRVHEILSDVVRKYADLTQGLHDGKLDLSLGDVALVEPARRRLSLRPVAWKVVILLQETERSEGSCVGRIEVLAVGGTGRLLVRFHPGSDRIEILARPWAHRISKKFEGVVDPSLVGGDQKEALKRYVAVAIDSIDWSGVGEEPPLRAWDALASKARKMFQAEVLRSKGASEEELEALGLGKSSLDDLLK